jgi:LysM repeat protein
MGLFFIFVSVLPCSADEIKHIVKKGDTLWDISNNYLKTPWKWPLVWANNEDITNPHLIYPGDTVIITRDHGKTVIKIIPAQGKTREATIYTPEQAAAVKEKTFVVSPQFSTYIYSPNILAGSGTVVQKKETGDLASQDEHLFIKTSSNLKEGQGITIVARLQDVKNGDETVGYLYKAVGTAVVEEVQSHITKARITFTLQEVRVGSVIFDDLAAIKPMTLTISEPALGTTHAKIIDLYGGVSGASDFDLVFTEAGKNQGVDKGAILSVAEPVTFDENQDQPISFHDYQGLVLILQSLDNSSMGLLLDTKTRIERGFVVTGKKK